MAERIHSYGKPFAEPSWGLEFLSMASSTRTSPRAEGLLSCGLCAVPSHLGTRVAESEREGLEVYLGCNGGRRKVNSYDLMSFCFVPSRVPGPYIIWKLHNNKIGNIVKP